MDIRLNDILIMKKPHPCGEKDVRKMFDTCLKMP